MVFEDALWFEVTIINQFSGNTLAYNEYRYNTVRICVCVSPCFLPYTRIYALLSKEHLSKLFLISDSNKF